MEKLDQRKSIWSWALYDWANSAFATTVMAGFFPLFFKEYWADPGNPNESTFYLGMANSIASIIIAALAPFLGAIADRGTAKKKLLFLFAFLGIIMTGGLWIVAQGHWQMAALFYVLAAMGFAGGNIFYDSLLPHIASGEKVDYTSSLGFALGYIGGGLLFLLNVIMFQKPELFGIPDGATAIKYSFLTVAVWWAVFSIPIALWVKEPKIYEPVGIGKAIGLGWKQLSDTLRDIRHLKVVGMFLFAYWLYIDGVDTIVKMAVDYGMSLGFPSDSLIKALLMVQFIAFPAALMYNWFAAKIGIKKAILIAILGYSIITFLGYFMAEEWHFYILAVLIGLFQGGIQALSRSLYTRIIPKKKSAEFFGFYNMLGKFAAVIGPALMGIITLWTGNARYGILSILSLFILGAYFLMKVNIEEGKQMADEFLSK
ncbi:MAG TPA: MFS transporter [Candidatus Marinimicrobia bacterium]|nr:MFS transporter [Candidatus Neomarinimicrobiota bacterium]MDP6260525.1 MFS transporter [Candidatus Neomarinimicrobiota bacterium]MDP7127686.1 MFS transporter [Candidatus Neomarinimicrobiota bacterium]MDP7475004.1 MFS transporter [Candidatus Neomarinimicrobiota bacterium]MDP7527515.1 MFS transporter [Candidatus Neomarinimicrobiota bacterium]